MQRGLGAALCGCKERRALLSKSPWSCGSLIRNAPARKFDASGRSPGSGARI